MPTYEFSGPDGKTYEVGAPEGATQEQAFQMLQGQLAAGTAPAATPPSATMSAGRALNDIPRQLGLTARYALEGPAQAAQIVTEPVRYLTDKLLPDRADGMPKSTPLGAQASKLADTFGLPKPETPGERVIGDASRLVAGAGGMAGAAQSGIRAGTEFLAGQAPALLSGGQNLLRGLASNIPAQLTSAAGAGLAGGASREAGGGPMQQAGAALLGGVAGGLSPSTAQPLIGLAKRSASRMTPEQIDVQLSTILQRGGTDYSQLPEAVRRSLRAEMSDALRSGRELDPAAVSRLADFRAVGAQPTRGMISQNPVQITREQNLAKMAANSADGELHGLPAMQNQNNQVLIGRLNDLGARSGVEPLAAGRTVTDAIAGRQTALRQAEQAAWDAAKASPGYRAPIQPNGLQAVTRALDAEDVLGDLPKGTSALMEAYLTGQRDFTPMAYRNIISRLSRESASTDPAQAYAAGLARRTLEQADLMPIKAGAHLDSGGLPITAATAQSMRAADAAPGNSVDLVNRARGATRAAYAYEDSNPLVRSALADARTADPEKIAKSFVLDGTLNDARAVVREVGPQGVATIREALANHIKKQAMGGASDEVGKVSQSQLNAAINKIGEEKLRLFFSPEEVTQLRSAARVASLMQVQPVGSAVNNSNSGALILGRGMDMLGSVAGRLPFGQAAIADPLRNLNISISQRAAQNVTPGLLRTPPPSNPVSPLLLPAAAVGGGLLSAP